MSKEASKSQCPTCKKETLLAQPLPDGSMELVCLELECDFAQVVSSHLAEPGEAVGTSGDTFVSKLPALPDQQLERMADNLETAIDDLSGRAKRTARRQLSVVRAELRERDQSMAADLPSVPETQVSGSRVPAQLNTPAARAKRRTAIRAYHSQRKVSADTGGERSEDDLNAWMDTFTKTLRREAQRHEQAARSYARVPELFPLHIDHSAKAFELNRILDLLGHRFSFVQTEEEM